MASITIRDLDDELKAKLRVRAAHHGHSMEQEVREILAAAVAEQPQRQANLAKTIRKRFAKFGGVKLEFPERDAMRPVPDVEV